MLTDEQKVLKDAIGTSERLLTLLASQIGEMKAICRDKFGHVAVEDVVGGARCDICSTEFGWYCPESPDHICHYETEIPEEDKDGST